MLFQIVCLATFKAEAQARGDGMARGDRGVNDPRRERRLCWCALCAPFGGTTRATVQEKDKRIQGPTVRADCQAEPDKESSPAFYGETKAISVAGG